MNDAIIRVLLSAGGLCFVVATFAATGFMFWSTIKGWFQGKQAYEDRRAKLAQLGFEIIDTTRMRGRIHGLSLTLEERPIATYAAEIEMDGRPVLSIGTPLTRFRNITCLSASLPTPLPSALTLAHTDSMCAPRPSLGSRPVPGHAHALADPSHSVHASDLAWAAAFLGRLAARGGLADLEAHGWRASFDSEHAYLEREGMHLPFEMLGDGAARLQRLIERLAAS